MSTIALQVSRESPSARADIAAIQPLESSSLLGRETGEGHGRTATPSHQPSVQPASAEAFYIDSKQVSRMAAASIAEAEVPKNQVVAEWHGMVTELLEASFVAELKGILGKDVMGAIEEAVIPIDEVRDEDLPFLVPGAFFRLTVNNVLRPGGKTRRRFTDVTFRRMPAYRREELEDAAKRGRALERVIRVE
jgi:hypothetical protein